MTWSCLPGHVSVYVHLLPKHHYHHLIIIYPLSTRVVWAPQMMSQPVSSINPVFHCPMGLGELQARPFPEVVFPPLPLSALSSSPFYCACKMVLGRPAERET